MLLTFKNSLQIWLQDIFHSCRIAGFEKSLAVVFGITLTQIHHIAGIMAIVIPLIVTIYFAIKKHTRRERFEMEQAEREEFDYILKLVNELTESNVIDVNLAMEEKIAVAREIYQNSKS